jgi:hypothetical protein
VGLELSRDELLSVLRVLFEKLNLKKYAAAYTQYLVDKYGIHDINELTAAHHPLARHSKWSC